MLEETNVGVSGQPTDAPDVSAPSLDLGQPTVGAAQAAREAEAVAGAAQVAPAAPSPQTPTLPEKFRGKSAEEIATAYLEVEREKGRLADEAGRTRQFAEQAWAELQQARAEIQSRQPYGPPQQPPPPAGKPEEFDFEHPLDSVNRAVERGVNERFNGFVGALQQARVAEAQGKAFSSWDEGEKHIKANPRLYDGIEEDVRKAMFVTYDPIVQRGGDVSEYYRNPKNWEAAALLVKFKRGDIDANRILGGEAPPAPMKPSNTEIPGGSRPGTGESNVFLDERTREMMREHGISEGEAREYIRLGKMTRR